MAQGVNVSRDLLWILTKNNNAYNFKRPGVKKTFSTHPLNPTGFQSFRATGLVQPKALNVVPAAGGKGVELVYRKRRHTRNPSKSLVRTPLTRGNRRTIRAIKKFVNGNVYRRDLKTTVLRKASALLRAQKKASKTAKKD